MESGIGRLARVRNPEKFANSGKVLPFKVLDGLEERFVTGRDGDTPAAWQVVGLCFEPMARANANQ
ncbi:MAG: hypothetical protein WCC14_12445 [Acidobacteriaceae bacterium]